MTQVAATTSIRIEPLTKSIGAEIEGVDLSEDLDAATFAELERAWNEDSVLVFRGQKLQPEDLVAFSRRFGPLEIHVLDQYLHPAHPEILVISNVVENGKPVGIADAGRYWHSDLSYMAEPSRGSILYAIEIPSENGKALGDTIWASAAAAYEALDEGMQKRLDSLEAAYSLGHRFKKIVADGNKDAAMTDTQEEKVPEVVHPVVRTHPVTGRKSIFVNEGHTSRILGLPEDESRELLDFLWTHCRKPEFTYRHHWRPGDVVMWDNIPTQHIAICDYALPQRRLLHRTTLTGGPVA
jgi:taurine dioxygenase